MERRHVIYAAGALALFTAVVHLISAVGGLYNWLVHGDSVSILPFAFVAFSLLVFFLIYTYSKGLLREAQAYAAASAVMVAPIVGYADWHAAGIAESALGLDDAGLGHEHSHNGDGHDHSGDVDHSHNGDHHDHHGDDDHTHNGDDDHSHSGDDHDHSHNDDDGHDSHDHSHEGGVVDETLEHLRNDMVALSTKLAEFGAAFLFAALAITER